MVRRPSQDQSAADGASTATARSSAGRKATSCWASRDRAALSVAATGPVKVDSAPVEPGDDGNVGVEGVGDDGGGQGGEAGRNQGATMASSEGRVP